MIETAVRFLIESQNSDGGWGTAPRKASATEATSFAVLALSVVRDASLGRRTEQGLRWLVERQRADGSFPLHDRLDESSWTTALAVLAAGAFERYREPALRGVNWLLDHEPRGLGWATSLLYRVAPGRLSVRLNPDLRGWPWTSGAFSWVEPTAYAVIALKKLRPLLVDGRAAHRIRQGELMIYDRMCAGGGWNYGNSRVLGAELPPYPDITALALIALQDHPAQEANRLGLAALERMLAETPSGLTLSWGILCLSLYAREVKRWRALLRRSYERTRFLHETPVMALALLASSDDSRAFAL